MTDVLTRGPANRPRPIAGALVYLVGALLTLAGAGAADEISFDVPSTRGVAGQTRVIAFNAPAADADRTIDADVADAEILEVMDKARVLAGGTTGFVRVRALKAGATMLTIGGAKLKVEVGERQTPELLARARFVEPANGAVVWGTFAVGVEVDEFGVSGPDPKDELRLSTGEKLEAVAVTPRSFGPTRRMYYKVDASSIPVGPLELFVGDEGAGEAQHVRVMVIKPETGEVTKIEAEEPFTGERPERFKRPKVVIGNDKDASGGKFVNNASADPAACLAFHVSDPGWYQVFVGAASDFGGGAFPTVGLVVDGAQYAATNARLCTSQWHRLALGVPIKLTAGDRVLTPYFLNDFAAGKQSDRNLRLDYIELVRVGSTGTSGGLGSMMGEQAMGGGSPMDSMMAMSGSGEDAASVETAPIRIGLSRVLDGQALAGELEVEGSCWFEGFETNPPVTPPLVTLLVNGEAVSKQWAVSPRFEIGAVWFKRGYNTVQLVAHLASGSQAKTPVQTMTWEPAGDAKTGRREFARFTVFDPRWEPDVRAHIQREQNSRERTALAFYSNGEATLNVPEDMTGSFDLFLEARGEEFKGPAIGTIKLRQGSEEPVLVKALPVPGRWDTRRVATVDLKGGPKQITVAFENDLYEEGKGDRNLFIQSLSLYATPQGEDKTAPAVAIEYPSAGASCYMADAVVATASDDCSLAAMELLIDGTATGQRVDVSRSTGRVVFPLLLRDVKPGRHTLAVRAWDSAKNQADSKGVSINVLAAAPATLGPYDRALRILDRFAFGPDPDSLAGILTKGEARWLSDSLSAPFDDAGDRTAFENGIARFPNGRGAGDVQRRAVMHALTTPNPARARFVLWAENHFSTWIRKTEGPRKWAEHVAFERLGVAPFRELLECSSRSPAMLRYLDQETSFATRLNENYAREIMELHCLGVHGGYTQQDVTSLAHLLTGWTVSHEGDSRSGGDMALYNFRFDPSLNDLAEIKVIGVDFAATDKDEAYDRIAHALEVLTAHPSTAPFIAKKLADHYLGCPAPEAVVKELTRVYEATDGDMKEMLLALARHPAFWAPENGAPKGTFPAQRLAHPQDFAIRLARVSRHLNANHVVEFLARVGQNLFDRPTPDGYSELDSDYTDSNAMIQRWRFAHDTSLDVVNLVPEAWRVQPAPVKADAKAAGASKTPATPASTAGDRTLPSGEASGTPDDSVWAQQVVDVLAVRLTGRVLSPASNDAALKVLAEIEGKRPERIQRFVPLMAQLPEANLR